MSTAPDGSTLAGAAADRELVVLLAGHDTDELREYVAPLVDRPAVTVETVDDGATAVERLEDRAVDCLVASYDPKSAEGMAVLDYLREAEADVPVILLPSTRTTVIDSRNFVVDVESVVDPDEPVGAGDLADPVVSTVEQQRAAVAARRRHQLESAGRAVARDAGNAGDEDAVARSLAERLGDTDAVDAAWVAALGDEGVDVRAAAGDTPTGVGGPTNDDGRAGAGEPPGRGGHGSGDGRAGAGEPPGRGHGGSDGRVNAGGNDGEGDHGIGDERDGPGGPGGEGSSVGGGAAAGDGTAADGAAGDGTAAGGAAGDGTASPEIPDESGNRAAGDAVGARPGPGTQGVDGSGGDSGVDGGDGGPGVQSGGGPGVQSGGAVPGERVREAVEEAFDSDGPAVAAGEEADLAAVPVETPGGERWGLTVASDSRYAFAEPEVRALAALGDTVERALSAVASAPTRLPTDAGAAPDDVDPGAFAALVEHLEVPVVVYDEGGLVHAASPGFGELLERDHEALSGEPVWEVLPEPRIAAFDEHWAAFEEGDARIRTLTLGGRSCQVVTTRLVVDERPYNVVLPVEPEADADTWLAEVLAYELRHWMAVAEEEGTDEETLDSVADRVESALDAEVDASGSVSGLQVTAQPLGGVASEAWAHVLGDAGDSAVQGGRTVLADRTVLFRLFTHLFRTLLTYGEASAVSVGVAEDGFFVRDDGSGVPHDERAYADAASMTDAGSGASIRVARRLAQRQGWELAVAANEAGGTRFDVRGVRSPYRDVDDAELRETQLGVFNRVLRHNVRNTVNVVRGNAGILAERLEGPEAELFEHLHAATEELVAVGDRAHEFEQLESRDEVGRRRVDLASVVRRVVDEVAGEFPDAAVTAGVGDGTHLETYPDALRIVLANLVRNAVEHNDRATPTVTVTAREANGTVGVAVRDDGPGIPDEELEVLSAGSETALEHGSGLGLWIAKWGVQHLGGDLTFQANDPRGTTAVVTLPRTAPGRDDHPSSGDD